MILLVQPSRVIQRKDTSALILISWRAPNVNTIPSNDNGKLINYGRELIINTTFFLGPNGTVAKMSNGMNCQNCHLDAGTKLFGNNFSTVAADYPKYRPRYGRVESVEKRINDCFERSLNGSPLDSTSNEMLALVAYIRWVGKDVKKGDSIIGSSTVTLPFLDRAASPENGKIVYNQKCSTCHGKQGEGLLTFDSSSWQNPPLWGSKSYNIGAGMYRLSHFARFVKTNMPLNPSANAPQLTDEEAWDVAAYVNSMPRPEMSLNKDWPKILEKPPDYPVGPFADNLPIVQHKYGPFKPILETQKKMKSTILK
jgi:thiosulfate dehydrogenase